MKFEVVNKDTGKQDKGCEFCVEGEALDLSYVTVDEKHKAIEVTKKIVEVEDTKPDYEWFPKNEVKSVA